MPTKIAILIVTSTIILLSFCLIMVLRIDNKLDEKYKTVRIMTYGTTNSINTDQELIDAVETINKGVKEAVSKKHLTNGATLTFEEFKSELPASYQTNIQNIGGNILLTYPKFPGRAGWVVVLNQVPTTGEPYAVGIADNKVLPEVPPTNSKLESILQKIQAEFERARTKESSN